MKNEPFRWTDELGQTITLTIDKWSMVEVEVSALTNTAEALLPPSVARELGEWLVENFGETK